MATYYVKVGGISTGVGTDPSIAWNLSKLQSTTLNPGDTVLFNRGDVFLNGTFSLANGTSGNPVTYGAYGTGANPLFNGMGTTLTWTLSSGNIYYTDQINVAILQVVTVNNVLTGMGRYPKNSWLVYDSTNVVLDNPATTTINEYVPATTVTGTSVGTIPFNATGGELVIKKQRYIIDRNPITGHSGNTLNIGNNDVFGDNHSVSPDNGNGYFIQAHLSCLTQLGDWYYNRSTKRLYMHFGTGNSTSATIKASGIDAGATGDHTTYVNISNIDFTGYNISGIYIPYSDHINITNCNISNVTDAIFAQQGNGFISINNCTVSNTLSSGITGAYQNHDFSIIGCTITNVGMIKGMQKSGEGRGNAITIDNGPDETASNILVQNNVITNTGYCGIAIYAMSGWTVEGNKVDNFCTNKDDGGGIYTYGLNDVQTYSNRVIRNNVVLNGVGAYDGSVGHFSYDAYGKCFGIYLDGFSNHTEVYNNTLGHGDGGGVLISPNSSNQIYNNLIYDFRFGFYIFALNGTNRLRTNTITGNKIIARTSTQKCIFVELYEGTGNISLWGTWSGNTYARPIDDTNSFTIDDRSGGGQIITNFNLATWKTYGLDANAVKAVATTTDVSNIRFDYNYSPSTVIVSLPGTYKDVNNTSYVGSRTLSAYSGAVSLFVNSTGATKKIIKSTPSKILVSGGKIITG